MAGRTRLRMESPSPLMGEGWGEGAWFDDETNCATRLAPLPNPSPAVGRGAIYGVFSSNGMTLGIHALPRADS